MSANPTRTENREGSTLRVGECVIQQVNDYQREVFNGEIGTVTSIGLEEQEMIVQFAERAVTYDYADLAEIALAWAVTVHKSQGSEYPVVVLPLFPQHYLLLSRKLVYTGLRRAKKLSILVGPTKAIGVSIKRVTDHRAGQSPTKFLERFSQLREQRHRRRVCMLCMVIEHFKNRDAKAVYLRAQEQGRMLPEGLAYVGSWVEDTFDRCFQVMECEDPRLFQQWTVYWEDLVAFEIVHVVSSTEARDAALSGQDLPQVEL